MEKTTFNSKDIKSASYDETTQELYIRFTNGDYFVYYDVITADYVGFLSTDDHSKYVFELLDSKYNSRKLN